MIRPLQIAVRHQKASLGVPGSAKNLEYCWYEQILNVAGMDYGTLWTQLRLQMGDLEALNSQLNHNYMRERVLMRLLQLVALVQSVSNVMIL